MKYLVNFSDELQAQIDKAAETFTGGDQNPSKLDISATIVLLGLRKLLSHNDSKYVNSVDLLSIAKGISVSLVPH
jgi:hypothetical protein